MRRGLCSLIPSHSSRTMELFCARATNHKQSLIINPACSASVPGSTEQLASACDPATAEVSISNSIDRKGQVMPMSLFICHQSGLWNSVFLVCNHYTHKYHVDMRTYLCGLGWCQTQRSLHKITTERSDV